MDVPDAYILECCGDTHRSMEHCDDTADTGQECESVLVRASIA